MGVICSAATGTDKGLLLQCMICLGKNLRGFTTRESDFLGRKSDFAGGGRRVEVTLLRRQGAELCGGLTKMIH